MHQQLARVESYFPLWHISLIRNQIQVKAESPSIQKSLSHSTYIDIFVALCATEICNEYIITAVTNETQTFSDSVSLIEYHKDPVCQIWWVHNGKTYCNYIFMEFNHFK